MVFIAMLATVWLSVAMWRMSKGSGTPQLLLGVLPIALLFPTVLPAMSVVGLIRGFQHIAEQGSGGVKAIAPYCLDLPRSLESGAIGFLATAGVAAMLQMYATRVFDPEAPPSTHDSESNLTAWVLVASSILIVPVAIEIQLVRGIPELLTSAVVKALTPSELAALTNTISRQCVLAVFRGLALGAVLAVCGAANLVAICRGRTPGWVSAYAWIALVAAGVLAGWLMVRTAVDMRMLEVTFR